MPKAYFILRQQYIAFPKEIYHFPVKGNIAVVAEIPFRDHPSGLLFVSLFGTLVRVEKSGTNLDFILKGAILIHDIMGWIDYVGVAALRRDSVDGKGIAKA